MILPKEDWLAALIVGLCALLWCCVASAEVDNDQAIKALIGEAIGQGDAELLAHAQAIRHRGTLSGVYGLRNWHKHNTPENWQRASKAWYTAELVPDTVNGATHWLSEYDLNHSRPELIEWRFKAVYSVKVGQTTFYRMK